MAKWSQHWMTWTAIQQEFREGNKTNGDEEKQHLLKLYVSATKQDEGDFFSLSSLFLLISIQSQGK